MSVKLIFAWYDLWIGFFWDIKKKWLYIFIIPTVGIIIQFKKKPLIDVNDPNQPWNYRKEQYHKNELEISDAGYFSDN